MSTASPWFGLLYVAAFSSALVAILYGDRLVLRARLVLSAFTVIVAAYCVGVGVRGVAYDISGTQLPAPATSAITSPAALTRLGRPSRIDGEISVDRIDPPPSADFRQTPIDVTAGGTITITGWAFDVADQARCSGIAAVIGQQTFTGRYGLERPDVDRALGTLHRFTGYSIVIPGASIAPGRHVVEIRCIAGHGHWYASPTKLSLEVGK